MLNQIGKFLLLVLFGLQLIAYSGSRKPRIHRAEFKYNYNQISNGEFAGGIMMVDSSHTLQAEHMEIPARIPVKIKIKPAEAIIPEEIQVHDTVQDAADPAPGTDSAHHPKIKITRRN